MGGPETQGDGDLHFHYNQSERLRGVDPLIRQRAKDEVKKGFWYNVRKNKRLGITFADLVIILLLAFLLVPFLSRLADKEEWGPVQFSLKAYSFDGKTLVSLKVKNTSDSSLLDSQIDPMQVTFMLDKKPAVSLWLTLPGPGAEEIILRHQFDELGKAVQAEILWGNKRRVLEKYIEEE